MSDTWAKMLAEIDDPETMAQTISEFKDQGLLSFSDESKLTDLYDRYLSRRQDRRASTRAQYKRTLPPFIQYCNDIGVTHPNTLTATHVDRYVDQLKETYDADATVLTHTKNVRAWLSWISKRGFFDDPLHHLLDKEELGLSPKARDEALPEPVAKALLQTLREQRFGSHFHTILALAWNAGPRVSGLRALDVSDFTPSEQEIYLRHRPNEGTPLKNGSKDESSSGDSERYSTLHPRVVDALTAYIEGDRPSVTDDYGRQPLFATSRGRASKSTLRRWLYEATSCRWLHDGPVDITCDGSCAPDTDVCQHSYYPHAVRRGSIVKHLSGGLRLDRASQRFDVSIPVLKAHYDPRTHARRKNDREQAVKDAWSDGW